MEIILPQKDPQVETVTTDNDCDMLVVVIWDVRGGRKWYVGLIRKQLNDNWYLVDHMELASRTKGSKGLWRWPLDKEELEVESDQIIPVNVIGSWDLSCVQRQGDASATGVFVLDNWEIIEGVFKSMYCQ